MRLHKGCDRGNVGIGVPGVEARHAWEVSGRHGKGAFRNPGATRRHPAVKESLV